MAETIQSLDQLSALKPATPEAPKYIQKLDKQGRAYATGKRKNAVARVWIKRGPGKITVNDREIEVFFARVRRVKQLPLLPDFLPLRLNLIEWIRFAAFVHAERIRNTGNQERN